MAVVKNLMVRGGADFSEMKKGLQQAQKDIQSFKSGMTKALAGVASAIAAIGIGAAVKNAVKSAMDVEAAMGQLGRLMGDNADAFISWGNSSAIAFGMARSEAIKFGAVYSNLLSTFTKSTSETMKYTQDLLQASAVIAAKTGRSIEDVMFRIRSGLLGNTEAVEDLGINVYVNLLESTKSFRKFAGDRSWNQLDFQTQQTIRYFAIMEQAASKFGLELADNTLSRQQKFMAHLKNLQTSLGQAFLPIYNIVLPALTSMAQALANVMSVVAQFSQALFGANQASTKATDNQAAAVEGLAGAYDAAGKAARGSVAGFDEVNSLADKSAAGSGASPIATALGNADSSAVGQIAQQTKEVSQRVKEMADKVKEAFSGMRTTIDENKDAIIASLAALAAGFTTYLVSTNLVGIVGSISAAFKGLRTAIATAWLALTGPIGLVVAAIVAAVAVLVGTFVYFYRTNEEFRTRVNQVWHSIVTNVKAAVIAIWQFIAPIVTDLVSFLVQKFEEFRVFWMEIWPSLKEAFANIWTGIWFVLKPIIDAIVTIMRWAWPYVYGILVGVINAIKGVVSGLFTAIMGLLKTFAGLFTADWSLMWEGVKQLLYGALEFIFNFLQLWGFSKIIGSFLAKFGPAVVTGFRSMTDDVVNLFKGMGGKINDVWSGLVKVTKATLNVLIGAINKFISGFNGISISVPKFDIPLVGEVGGFKVSMPQIPKLPKLARGGIVDGETNMGNYIAGEAGAEMIVPLENTSFVDKLASALGTAVLTAMQATNQNSAGGTVELSIDGVTFARLINPYTAKESTRIGGNMITVT